MNVPAIRARKKPVEIQAMLHDGTPERALELVRWIGAGSFVHDEDDGYGHAVSIPTLEGTMRADPGDYVIRGVRGEHYPCKPDIFAATYDILPSEWHTIDQGPAAEVFARHAGTMYIDLRDDPGGR